jgi:hypothetical protein
VRVAQYSYHRTYANAINTVVEQVTVFQMLFGKYERVARTDRHPWVNENRIR